MKTLLFVLFLLCTTAALGQSSIATSALSNQPQVIQVPTHPEHAAQKPLASEQNLLGDSGYFHAQGKRPLWEVAPIPVQVPLGDLARMLRKEHETAKKASVVREN